MRSIINPHQSKTLALSQEAVYKEIAIGSAQPDLGWFSTLVGSTVLAACLISFRWVITSAWHGNYLVMLNFLLVFLNTETAFGDISLLPITASGSTRFDSSPLALLQFLAHLDEALRHEDPIVAVFSNNAVGPWFQWFIFIKNVSCYVCLSWSGTPSDLFPLIAFFDAVTDEPSLTVDYLTKTNFWPMLHRELLSIIDGAAMNKNVEFLPDINSAY